jgi:acetolactate synthase-1/2/3 large subunit
MTTFAQAFAAALEDLGVRHAFGVSGGAISAFWSALADSGIEVTHFRHESGAAFAACEASIDSGAPVVVFVTSGPGVTNVLTGMYAARHEPAQVILVSACTESAMYGRRPIQETGPRTLPQGGIFTAGPLFDYGATVTDPARLPALVAELSQRLAGRFVAHLSLTLAVQRAEVAPVSPRVRVAAAAPDEAAAGHAAAAYALLCGQPWVMWVGGGMRALAGPARRLACAAGVPVMATPRGKGVIAEGDPAYLGVTGFAGHGTVLAHLAEHPPEYTLVLGSSLGDFATGYHPAYAPASAFIHVDVDPSVYGQAYPAVKTVPVPCDAGRFCAELAALFEARPAAPLDLAVTPFAFDDPATGPVDPGYAMRAVQSVLVDNGVLVLAETGNTLAWAISRLRFADPRCWRAPSGLVGSMGHFSTAVVGAALASGRKAAALVGDGSMLMLNEVSTAVHTGAPAIWVVFNDSSYNMCAQGARHLGLSNVDAAIPPTDFALLARALGAEGRTVDHPADLTGALTAALEASGPYVVDIRIDAERPAPTMSRAAGLLRDSTGD